MLIAILSVTTIAVVMFGVPLAVVVERLADQGTTLRVEREAVLAARGVPADFATTGDPVELPPGADGVILALYDGRGRLIAGEGPLAADAATRKALADNVVDIERSGSVTVAVPVSADERIVGAIRAQRSTHGSNARAIRIAGLLGVLAVGVLAVGAVIGYVVAGRLARPVRRLRDAAVQLGDGDFTIDMPRSSVPELDEAAAAMTLTARRLDELVARERAFSADASHQLRTPLAGLRAALETEIQFPRADHTAVLHEALADVDRLESTIAVLLAIARSHPDRSRTVAVGAVLDEVERSWHGRFAAVGRPLVVADAGAALLAFGSPDMLRNALDVLVDNALVHGAGITRIDVDARSDTVSISVSDDGVGFASVTSVDPVGVGSHGLGLPLAHRLVAGMDGRLSIVRIGARTRVDIVLSRADRDRVEGG